jgi:integrase
MARKPLPVPSYRPHKRSGRAIVTVRNHLGARQDILLPGDFGSPESREEYDRICAQVRTNTGTLPPPATDCAGLTIAELVLRFMDDHASGYYVEPGTRTPTRELEWLTLAFRPLKRMYGSMPVAEFKPKHLEALQRAMATGSWQTNEEHELLRQRKKPIGLARRTLNARIERIRRLFRWGCSKELVAAESLTKLETLATLKENRSSARETPPVVPVDPAIVEATLPTMPAVPADIVRLLLLSGARVGEICRLRGRDLDRNGPVWLYRVARHKTQHLGHTRTVAFGPKAQLILRRYLKADPDALLFSPAEAERQRKADMRANRRSPVQPSQLDRSRPNAKRRPGAAYDHRAINHAIRRGCIRAGAPLWHTHQLRHTAALLVMREHGVEAARSVLGHKTLNVTLPYSGIDLQRAAEVMSKIG